MRHTLFLKEYHRIAPANIRLSQHRNKKRTVKITCNDWSSLSKRDNSNRYTVTVRKKFNTLQEIVETHTPNDKYENGVVAHIEEEEEEAVKECIPTKPRAKCRLPQASLVVRKKRTR